MVNVDDTQMDNGSPRANSPIKQPTPEKEAAPPAKKQLSSAQKASLARAREKARQSKLAKSQAKADQEKEFAKFQAVTKPPSPTKEQSDESMTESESEASPSPVKKKKTKRHAKKKRRHMPSSESDTSEDDPVDAKQRLHDHAALAKQVYENNLSCYKSDVVSLSPRGLIHNQSVCNMVRKTQGRTGKSSECSRIIH